MMRNDIRMPVMMKFDEINKYRITFGKTNLNEFTLEELEERKKHFMNMLVTLPYGHGLLDIILQEYKLCDEVIKLKSIM